MQKYSSWSSLTSGNRESTGEKEGKKKKAKFLQIGMLASAKHECLVCAKGNLRILLLISENKLTQ